MNDRFRLVIAVTCLVTPGLAQAAERAPLRLTPSSNWHLDYADDSCRMSRDFGTGEQKTTFAVERYEPGDKFALLVAGNPLNAVKGKLGQTFEAKLRFGPFEAEQTISVSPATLGDAIGILVASAALAAPAEDIAEGAPWPTLSPEREAAVTQLRLNRIARQPIVLELGSMGKPMAALRACTDELLTHWGIDVALHANRSKVPVPAGNPGKWLRSEDYPSAMLRNGNQGLVQFRLMVGADGKPTSCHIQRSTRPKELDDMVCHNLMRRARFTPALDAEGKPIASYFQSSVRFQIYG